MHVHDHDHDGDHPSDPRDVAHRVASALALTAALMVVEFVGGWFSGSLALMADAGHMLSDAAALGASWWALRCSLRPATDQRTFGQRRSETLAALFNGALLFLVAGGILHEAWERFSDPTAIRAGLMLAISLVGLLANIGGLLLLHRDRNSSLNLEGAWQHVMGDAAGSVCAVAAAIGILLGGQRWAILDPIASAAVSLLILLGAYRLLKRTVAVLMEHAPSDVDVRQVRETITSTPGVVGVHCLHVWTISTNCRAMSAHVAHSAECSSLELLHELHKRLSHSFRVEHVTLQLEPPGFDGCTGHDEWCGIEPSHELAST
jgi:cobalt-zinc-cadmium efflux system protein